MNEELKNTLESYGYKNIRMLPTGEIAGIMRMAFTYGLFVGLDKFGYRCRYCYEFKSDAIEALSKWDGNGHPEGPWIKHKGRDRNGNIVDDVRIS